MESNRYLVFFLFGLSMLPKIYSGDFPSLILVKSVVSNYTFYDPADRIEYAGNKNNLVEFFTSSGIYSSKYPIYYNACPREDHLLHWTSALEIKGEMTKMQPMTLERFVKGLFLKYNCESKIKPIALKYQGKYGDKFAPVGLQKYDIGFLVYDSNALFEDHINQYKNAANERLPLEYHLVKFLTVTMDKLSGTIYSVSHKILSGQFLKPDLVLNPLPANEKNIEEYGFDVDSLYTEENQRNILSSIFRRFDPEHILIKVQLAPYQDFLLDTWKLSSLMDLNTVPMWKKVHNQWIEVEKFVRKVARELGDLSVETGTAQILNLHDLSQQLKPVYLGKDQKVPVSKYVWKRVVINPSHSITRYSREILIVMHNDPYTANQERICGDGNDYGWLVSNNDIGTGLTYVCPLHEDIEDITIKLHKVDVKYLIFKLNNMQKLDDDDDSEEDKDMPFGLY